MKNFISLFLAVAMLLVFTACGKTDAEKPDSSGTAPTVSQNTTEPPMVQTSFPITGTYDGVYTGILGPEGSLSSDVNEVYPMGKTSLGLEDGGKATLILGGAPIEGQWRLEGENLWINTETFSHTGVLKNGIIILNFQDEMDVLFAQDGVQIPEKISYYTCSICGWEPAYKPDPPLFCPECGDSFGDEDVIPEATTMP